MIAGWYARFTNGFVIVSMFLGIVNFAMIAITFLTVKGISIPAWVGIAAGISVVATCIIVGYLFEKTRFLERVISHQNQTGNPEVKQIHAIVSKIANKLDVEQ